MLIWLYGNPINFSIDNQHNTVRGILNLEYADVDFMLSIDKNNLPYDEWKPYRNLTINNEKFNFSEGFTELHNISYQNIIEGKGFGPEDIRPAIELIEKMVKHD